MNCGQPSCCIGFSPRRFPPCWATRVYVRVTSGYRSASRHMSDDKTKRGPQDRSKINVQEKYEMDYRSKKFGVTRDELRDAVKKVGPSAAAVERELKGSA